MTALQQARKLLEDATSRLEYNSPTEERYRLALAWLELAKAHHAQGIPEAQPKPEAPPIPRKPKPEPHRI
jgi:hypothetical protein